jgi:hypothetical protein
VLSTLGTPQRRLLRGRRGRTVAAAEPEPVPTSRATLIRPRPFPARGDAEAWLSGLRGDREGAEAEVGAATGRLNRALHAYRVGAADAYAGDVSSAQALVLRIGFGSGEAVAEGRYEAGWEMPRRAARIRRSMEAPDERFAAILSGRQRTLPCEELVLRARADIRAGRTREAALGARVALESLLAELGTTLRQAVRTELEEDRAAVGAAANAALHGELPDDLPARLEQALARMEAALKRRRMSG